MEERISMSFRELTRLEVFTAVKEGRLKQSKGARSLGVSPRQFRRLLRRFRAEGLNGIVSRKVGVPSNRQLSQKKKAQILEFFKEKDHHDFGPTLAHEYLMESGAAKISISAVRSVMIENGLWHPNEVRELNVHPLRQRPFQKRRTHSARRLGA